MTTDYNPVIDANDDLALIKILQTEGKSDEKLGQVANLLDHGFNINSHPQNLEFTIIYSKEHNDKSILFLLLERGIKEDMTLLREDEIELLNGVKAEIAEQEAETSRLIAEIMLDSPPSSPSQPSGLARKTQFAAARMPG